MWNLVGGAWLPLFTEMLLRAETGLVHAVSYLPIRTEHPPPRPGGSEKAGPATHGKVDLPADHNLSAQPLTRQLKVNLCWRSLGEQGPKVQLEVGVCFFRTVRG